MVEALHQASLVPLLVMIAVGRNLPRRYWWVAAAFFVSWFADSVNFFFGGIWAFSYLWQTVQFWLVVCAFAFGTKRALLCIGIMGTAAFSWVVSGPGPDVALMFVGSAVVLWLATGTLAIPVFLYFGLGTVAYFFMVAGPNTTLAWYAYQGCRLAAFLAFIGIITPQVIRNRGPANVGILD